MIIWVFFSWQVWIRCAMAMVSVPLIVMLIFWLLTSFYSQIHYVTITASVPQNNWLVTPYLNVSIPMTMALILPCIKCVVTFMHLEICLPKFHLYILLRISPSYWSCYFLLSWCCRQLELTNYLRCDYSLLLCHQCLIIPPQIHHLLLYQNPP